MTLRIMAAVTGAVLCLAAVIAVGGNVDPLPGDSLYQLPITLTTASGASMKLSVLRGTPSVITMFYSQCASVCPLLTMQLQRITQRLSRAEQGRIRVLMVSFDSVHDTPESLRAFAQEHHIAGDNWIIARASANDVRLLAATLGIQYRELPDHSFNHSTIISLADREGVIRDKTSDLSDVKGDFVAAVRLLAKAPRRAGTGSTGRGGDAAGDRLSDWLTKAN